jgi:hypothetical protein
MSQADQDASDDIITPAQYPWTNGQGTQTILPKPSQPSNGNVNGGTSTTGSTSTDSPDIGGQKPDAKPGDGLGTSKSWTIKPCHSLSIWLAVLACILI